MMIETETERPYSVGSSSSKSDDNAEVFKVYFKGLLSDERVSSNKVVKMAGTGGRSVEGHALIEALKAATALELNRIVFYCDYYPLYQLVSGRWRPKQQKIINFMDQLNLLRKSFTYCEHSLVARKDVKFAFKLAREAISSQKSKVVSSQEKLENCVICLDDKSVDQFFSIEGCTHRYCYSCVKQHVEVKLHSGVIPKCPHEGCGNELRIESCDKFLTPKFTQMMRQRLKEDSIPVTEKVYCPNPRCSTLMSTKEALRHPVLVYGFGARACYNCHGNFCVYCRVPWHENMTCAEFKRRNPTSLVEESKLKVLAARNMWRQCIKCKHMIELAAGCYHVTCRCGYEFCYTCGAEWNYKKVTCTCPLWHEENIVDTEEEDDFIGFEDDVIHGGEGDDFEHDVLEDEDNDFNDEDDDEGLEEDESDDFEHGVAEDDFDDEDDDLNDEDEGDDLNDEDDDCSDDDEGDQDVALEDGGDDFDNKDNDFNDEDEGDDLNDADEGCSDDVEGDQDVALEDEDEDNDDGDEG
uniref:RBR-type E3 ubiquitin transferase n=1 Tax=Helianthus annuus TaxID=4232 RepID=A0A251SRC1_HELAN